MRSSLNPGYFAGSCSKNERRTPLHRTKGPRLQTIYLQRVRLFILREKSCVSVEIVGEYENSSREKSRPTEGIRRGQRASAAMAVILGRRLISIYLASLTPIVCAVSESRRSIYVPAASRPQVLVMFLGLNPPPRRFRVHDRKYTMSPRTPRKSLKAWRDWPLDRFQALQCPQSIP